MKRYFSMRASPVDPHSEGLMSRSLYDAGVNRVRIALIVGPLVRVSFLAGLGPTCP